MIRPKSIATVVVRLASTPEVSSTPMLSSVRNSSVDYLERSGLPFVVAVNCFDGVLAHTLEDVREALVIGEDTPIVACDARVRESAKTTLIELVQHALARASAVLRSPADTRGGVGAGSANS